ncbi:glycoside hydrolase family 5 protein [Novosphingobium album (ex Hu et al. 2023)]|uniref:Glycoside hydrolase family 5 protein n=1 Tax=Novosphingobium album (ex Hu et al. 2023) TaxID=2930093 RepID=A0ABT0B5T0_9SPHN|nr:cellulase family glycosylhydrolase [Novosphingobium album (ex Hu et al. 2023)]MCJ2180432.1 glycoside hydrolase family 5 protein [Novosphingobium album (ex Hu et al. 2023)]
MFSASRRLLLCGGATAISAGLPRWARAIGSNTGQNRGDHADVLQFLGVNIAGAEFDPTGDNWHWPSLSNLTYYLNKGCSAFRIPFRWERLQPELRGSLCEATLQGLDTLVSAINANGSIAILDAHNFGRRDGVVIGGDGSPIAAADFADFWQRMGQRYKARPLVWYNLMNEPNRMPAEVNLRVQNAACQALRSSGASSKVLFSGIAFSGCHSWINSGNGKVMLGVSDPADNYAFDVHQYLDQGFSGTSSKVVPGAGSRTLGPITEWARVHGQKLFLGEFGARRSNGFLVELNALLAYMSAHRDVFIGGTYYAGGGSWRNNTMSTDPVAGVEMPQMLVLEKYLGK